VKVPTIYHNGTSEEALVDAIATAARSIRAAEVALAETAPHMRDYYPQPKGSFEAAQQEYFQRADKLQEVRSQLEWIWEQIANREGGANG